MIQTTKHRPCRSQSQIPTLPTSPDHVSRLPPRALVLPCRLRQDLSNAQSSSRPFPHRNGLLPDQCQHPYLYRDLATCVQNYNDCLIHTAKFPLSGENALGVEGSKHNWLHELRQLEGKLKRCEPNMERKWQEYGEESAVVQDGLDECRSHQEPIPDAPSTSCIRPRLRMQLTRTPGLRLPRCHQMSPLLRESVRQM